MATDGSTVLENTRHEAFAGHVAKGRSQLESWCMATNSEPSQGRTVTASNLVKRPEIAARISYLRKQLAIEREQLAKEGREDLTAGNLLDIMDRVTQTLVDASKRAKAEGFPSISTQINREVSTHVARRARLIERTGDSEKAPPGDEVLDHFVRTMMRYRGPEQ